MNDLDPCKSPNLEHALAYARLGWPVLPLHAAGPDGCTCGDAGCRSAGKHPAVRRGHNDATTDESTITGWFERLPHGNVGVATGEHSRLLVLDVDPRHGGDLKLAELLKIHGPLPATPCASTGGGGEHYFFTWNPRDGALSGRNGLFPGLDVKCVGGYVAAAPSMHASGKPYSWVAGCSPWEIPLAPAPAWLLDALAAHRPAGAAPAVVDDSPMVRVVSALGIVPVRAGKEIAVCCPRHADTRPSLMLNLEKQVWYCHPCGVGGGIARLRSWFCSTYAGSVGEAASIASVKTYLVDRLSFPDAETRKMCGVDTPWGPALAFPYTGEDGAAAFTRFRLVADGDEWTDPPDAPAILYGLGEAVAAREQHVVVVADELDVHALRALGVTSVVGLPAGQRTRITGPMLAPLTRFDTVLVALGEGDRVSRLHDDISRLLGRPCRRVSFDLEARS